MVLPKGLVNFIGLLYSKEGIGRSPKLVLTVAENMASAAAVLDLNRVFEEMGS
jgi:hypothetical protein